MTGVITLLCAPNCQCQIRPCLQQTLKQTMGIPIFQKLAVQINIGHLRGMGREGCRVTYLPKNKEFLKGNVTSPSTGVLGVKIASSMETKQGVVTVGKGGLGLLCPYWLPICLFCF